MAKIKAGVTVADNTPKAGGDNFVPFTFPADGDYVVVPVLQNSMIVDGELHSFEVGAQYDYTTGTWNEAGRSIFLAYIVSMPSNLPEKKANQLEYVGRVAPIVTAHGIARDLKTALHNEDAKFFDTGNTVYLPSGELFTPDDDVVDEYDGYTAEYMMLNDDGTTPVVDGTCIKITRASDGKRTTYTISQPNKRDMKTANGLMESAESVPVFEMTLADVVRENQEMLERIAKAREGNNEDTSIL